MAGAARSLSPAWGQAADESCSLGTSWALGSMLTGWKWGSAAACSVPEAQPRLPSRCSVGWRGKSLSWSPCSWFGGVWTPVGRVGVRLGWRSVGKKNPDYQLLVLLETLTPRCQGFRQPGASSRLSDAPPLLQEMLGFTSRGRLTARAGLQQPNFFIPQFRVTHLCFPNDFGVISGPPPPRGWDKMLVTWTGRWVNPAPP